MTSAMAESMMMQIGTTVADDKQPGVPGAGKRA